MSEYDEQDDRAADADVSDVDAFDDDAVGQEANSASSPDAVSSDGWEAPTTGVAAVDAVLASVQALDDRPVAEHVAVFEQAHDQLRRALDPGHG
jgi:hypothetical protein